MRRSLQALLLGLAAALPASGSLEEAQRLETDYHALQEWRFSTTSVPVPAGGLAWQIDDATIHLQEGELWLQEPTSDGRITGAVFEGRGRLDLPIADPVEAAQFRRFAKEPDLDSLSVTFDQLVLRTAGDELDRWAGEVRGSYKPHRLARDRHREWLRLRRLDADARVIAASANADGRYLRADMQTDEFGWLTFEYDSAHLEEIKVEKLQSERSFLERWLSLDRAEDRSPGGRPGDRKRRTIDVQHAEAAVQLLRRGKDPPSGVARVQPLVGDFRVDLRFEALLDGVGALELSLSPWAKVLQIRNEAGESLPFLRDHLGSRSNVIDRRIYDSSLIVLLPRPLTRGEVATLTFEYEMEVANFVSGGAWYPSAENLEVGISDVHTARFDITVRDAYEVRGMGRLESEHLEEGLRRSIWVIDEPVKMTTFNFARYTREYTLEAEGVPPVITFGAASGYNAEEKFENVAEDVANSIRFYQKRFDSRLPEDRAVYATTIAAFHGQAFEGFLHLSDVATASERGGPTQRFRAHEVAHQWWGHRVGWDCYRDQWLSESLSQYSSMLFVRETMDQGEKLFREMRQAFTDEVMGSIESSLSRFSRPGLALLNRQAADRIGPIGHGYRAATSEAPSAWFTLGYHKGALVLLMLEELLAELTGSEDALTEVLREFVKAYSGGSPSTEDLIEIVNRHAGADLSWFFAQWIYGAEIPTLDWDYRIAPAEDGFRIDLDVRQEDVSRPFRIPVPVRISFEDGEEITETVWVADADEALSIEVGGRPAKVAFNDGDVILAKIKRR